MKKIFYLIGVVALFLITSCDNDDITLVNQDDTTQVNQEAKGFTPTIQGTMGKFTDSTVKNGTRAGVIEDRDTFVPAQGEKFYWHDGDQVKVLFVGADGNEVAELTYEASVPDGDKPKTANFSIVDGGTVPAGTYTVYSLYPAEGWTKNDQGKWSVSIDAYGDDPNNALFIPIHDASSEQSGKYMYMKAKAEDVTIEEGGSNEVNLSYKHLTSMLRFRIAVETVQPQWARLYRLSLGVAGSPKDNPAYPNGFDKNFNPTAGYLDDLDDDSFVPAGNLLNVARVQMPQTVLNNTTLNGLDFDLFIPILPTAEIVSKTFTVAPIFRNASGADANPQPTWVTVDKTAVPGTLRFEAGKSYFFDITL